MAGCGSPASQGQRPLPLRGCHPPMTSRVFGQSRKRVSASVYFLENWNLAAAGFSPAVTDPDAVKPLCLHKTETGRTVFSRQRPPSTHCGHWRRSIAAIHACLFDHLGCLHQNRIGNLDAERLGGLAVDDDLELRELLCRQVGRLLALKNFIEVIRARQNSSIGLALWLNTPPASARADLGG
jgi:hypothetical protein